MMTRKKPDLSYRFESARAARIAGVQALFQYETTQTPLKGVREEFYLHRLTSTDYPHLPNKDLFDQLLITYEEHESSIKHMLQENLPEEWTLDDLDPVLRAALLVAITELMHAISLPAPVVMSEYIDIAKGFCGIKEAGFANRVLDQIAKTLQLPLRA